MYLAPAKHELPPSGNWHLRNHPVPIGELTKPCMSSCIKSSEHHRLKKLTKIMYLFVTPSDSTNDDSNSFRFFFHLLIKIKLNTSPEKRE